MNSSHSSISGLLIALVVCLAVGLVVLFVKIIPRGIKQQRIDSFPMVTPTEAVVPEEPIDEGITNFEDFGLYKLYSEKIDSKELKRFEKADVASTDEVEIVRERTPDDDRIYEHFEKIKQLLREKLGMCSSLEWERFETVDLVMVDESATGEKKGGKVLAHYSETNNRIYVLDSARNAGDDELDSILDHELAHSLTTGDGPLILYEGLAENIALTTTGRAVGDSYVIPMCLMTIIVDKVGIEDALMYIRGNYVGGAFDVQISNGAYKDLVSISYKYINGECSNIELLAAWDLLCHFAIKWNMQDSMRRFSIPWSVSEECQAYFDNLLTEEKP